MRFTAAHAILLGAFIGVPFQALATPTPCPDGKCLKRVDVVVAPPKPVEPAPVDPAPVEPAPAGPAPAKPGNDPAPPKNPNAPAPKPDEPDTQVCKRADDDGCSDPGSLGSFNNLRYVGMGKFKTSVKGQDPVAVTGLNGCVGLFFHGEEFVTGVHVNPDFMASETTAGAKEANARGTVISITIKATDAEDFTTVKDAIGDRFPDVPVVEETYTETTNQESFTTFTAAPGSTTVETEQDHLGDA